MPIRSRVDLVVLGRVSSRAVCSSRHELGALLRYHLGGAAISSEPTVRDERAPVALRAEETGAPKVYRIIVRVAQARRVRIRADFTSWEALPLRRTSGGEWEAVLDVDPGLHRILLSIDDDDWAAPTGLPVAPDGFGSDVGVLRVPS